MRDAVIGNYIEGVKLPGPALSKQHWRMILTLIRDAWSQVRLDVESKDYEPKITTVLALSIELCLRERHFALEVVTNVANEAKTIDYEGQNVGRKPDLHLFLTELSGGSPCERLFCEAKVINDAKAQTLKKYFDDGIGRFVEGEYGWKRSDGLMLGYVRDNQTLEGHLKPELEQRMKISAGSLNTTQITPTATPDLLLTTHSRHFTVKSLMGDMSPGPITLTHLWLNATQ